jgi:hypothetical protein
MTPYFPTEEERRYYCPNCKGWYGCGNSSCLVLHAPGTCCHEHEVRVLAPQPDGLEHKNGDEGDHGPRVNGANNLNDGVRHAQ